MLWYFLSANFQGTQKSIFFSFHPWSRVFEQLTAGSNGHEILHFFKPATHYRNRNSPLPVRTHSYTHHHYSLRYILYHLAVLHLPNRLFSLGKQTNIL
jgi:hypothetical protein